MNEIRRILHINRLFITGFLSFFIVAFCYCCCWSKSVSFTRLNFLHTYWLDRFFIFYTLLGECWPVIILLVLFLLRRHFLPAIHIVIAFLSSGLIAQVIKNIIHAPRPKVFFQPEAYSNFIVGVTRGGWASFPSGHTVTAFALATILALHARQKWYGLVYLFLAVGVGYSRIYLGQHFLEDVTAGALIGVLFGISVYIFITAEKLFRRTIVREPVYELS